MKVYLEYAKQATGFSKFFEKQKFDWNSPEIVKKKQKQDQVALLNGLYVNQDTESQILSLQNIQELLLGFREEKWTCRDVLLVFGRVAVQIDEQHNCISELFLDQALEMADVLDEYYRQTKTLVGPFHGLPLILSDECDIQDIGCSCGANKKRQDSPLVEQLKAEGGIPFCKTNVPWHLIYYEPANPLIGITCSSFKNRISFGGRGGALSLLLSKYSFLVGVGTDQSGGMRIPASHFELFTMKPTSYRVLSATRKGIWDSIPSVATPASRDFDSLVYVLKTLFSLPTHGLHPNLPFNTTMYHEYSTQKKLKVGYFVNDGVIRACPTARRTVFHTIEKLHKLGHIVMELPPPCPKQALLILCKLYCLHKSHPTCKNKRDITSLPPLWPMSYIPLIPQFIRHVLLKLVGSVVNDPFFVKLVDVFGGGSSTTQSRSLDELIELQVEKEEYRKLFSLCWDVDVLVCPVSATPPLPLTSSTFTWIGSFYSSLFNLLDYPAGIVPNVTRVLVNDTIPNAVQYAHSNRYTSSKEEHTNILGIVALEEVNHSLSKVLDQSMGVQVVGRPFEEEKVLAAMKIISSNSD